MFAPSNIFRSTFKVLSTLKLFVKLLRKFILYILYILYFKTKSQKQDVFD